MELTKLITAFENYMGVIETYLEVDSQLNDVSEGELRGFADCNGIYTGDTTGHELREAIKCDMKIEIYNKTAQFRSKLAEIKE